MSDVSGQMLWFGFTFGSNFTFLSLKLIITQTKENKTPSTLASHSHAGLLLARNAILLLLATKKQATRNETSWGVSQQVKLGTILRVAKQQNHGKPKVRVNGDLILKTKIYRPKIDRKLK